jgi:hypothetical protein
MPFPAENIPPGHTAKSVQGTVKGNVFLAVRYTTPDGTVGYDGTCVLTNPFAMVHVPIPVAEAAFLKGIEWLEKQKQKPPTPKA